MYNIIFFNTEICGVFNRNNSIVKVSQNIFKIFKSVWWSMILVQHDIFGKQFGTTFFWFFSNRNWSWKCGSAWFLRIPSYTGRQTPTSTHLNANSFQINYWAFHIIYWAKNYILLSRNIIFYWAKNTEHSL